MPCYNRPLMPLEQAKNAMLDAIKPITQTETIALDYLLHRILAAPVYAPINVPTFDNSAMDGYAIYYDENVSDYTLVGESLAGHAFNGEISQGECVRIMTGAVIPQGANTVVMQEQAVQNNHLIRFNSSVKVGSNIRKAGSDIQKGALLLPKGKRLSAVDIGLLASIGLGDALVYEKLKVAVFSTGDELIQPNHPLKTGHIYDSNRPMLKAMLHALHIDVVDLGAIPDNKQAIKAALTQACNQAHSIITSGGVSVGTVDYTRDVLEQMGTIHFWKLAIKPGKPLAFGHINDCLFFGLPGNPVSSAVTFDVMAKYALLKRAGGLQNPPLALKAKACAPFRKKPGRTDYQRALYNIDQNGDLTVQPYLEQSSAVLSGFSGSNCYAVLEQNRDNIGIGEWLTIEPYNILFDGDI